MAIVSLLIPYLLLKKLYCMPQEAGDIKDLIILVPLTVFLPLSALHIFLWKLYRKNKPILILKPCSITCDAYPHNAKFFSFLTIKQDTSTTIFWHDIYSVTIEKYGITRRNRYFRLILAIKREKPLIIRLSEIDMPLSSLRKLFMPYKSIKLFDSIL